MRFLRERSCAGLEFSREPLCCAVPVDSDLASLDKITLSDLHDHSLLLIRRGWNVDIDASRDEILESHP